MAPQTQQISLHSLPTEILLNVISFVATPLADIRPTWSAGSGDIKSLSCVSKRLREMCLHNCLYHIRLWESVKDASEGLDVISRSPSLLQNARIIVFRYNMLSILNETPNVKELSLASDGGCYHHINRFYREVFRTLSLPNITILKLQLQRTNLPILAALPNLKAVSLVIHCHPRRAAPLKALASRNLEVLHLAKPMGILYRYGWTVLELTTVLNMFPSVRHFLFEGSLSNCKIGDLMALFGGRNIVKLAVTDERYLRQQVQKKGLVKQREFEKADRRAAAEAFFDACPALREICIGSSFNLEARVYQRKAGGIRPELVRSYSNHAVFDRLFLDEKSDRFYRYGTPDDPLRGDPTDARFREAYKDAHIDRCETSFWETEWKLAVEHLTGRKYCNALF
ncbi:hypothetical protein VTK73DRAFT_9318 [Phialemonium thermophilum]|uniref:F-box domain-containing protein n=1 Tax=Phialemonium thermophilum TaxID=223376 RepID=A0ABR3W311_9PEZI